MSIMSGFLLGSDEDGLIARARASLERWGSDADPAATVERFRGRGLAGTPDELRDGFARLAEVGVERVALQHIVHDDLETVELLGREVVARLVSARLGHVKLPVSDLEASRRFYSAALGAFGWTLVYDGPSSLGFGVGDKEPFAVEQTARPAVGTHIAFDAPDEATVDAFHAAALAAGGRDNGAPGPRPYGDHYYAAFVLDPDGHNIEAVFHG